MKVLHLLLEIHEVVQVYEVRFPLLPSCVLIVSVQDLRFLEVSVYVQSLR